VLGFDGTRYEGWQSQRKKGNTLQEIFEKHLHKILKEPVVLIGSSRTDSGVHALGFVAHFKTSSKLPDAKIKAALNFYLPRDIVVFSAKTTKDDFHARFHARLKIYLYQIWNSPTRPLFEAPRALWYPQKLDLALIKKGAKVLLGKHDFRAFADKGDEKKSFVRHLKSIRFFKKGPLIQIQIQGNGFLRHMIRILVGTLIEVGRKKISPERVSQILHSKNRVLAGPTAKAYGLTLLKVSY
jgi:tRNA pseudouridine38-40 synthase